MPSVQQAVVEAEDRHDAVVRVQGRAQRRVVAHAQVAREPDEGGHRYSRLPSGPEIEVQVLRVEPELLAQLLHPPVELHERLPEPLDLLVDRRAAVDPAQRLALHQLAEQLDDGQHELGQAALDGTRGRRSSRRGARRRAAARPREQVEVGRCVQDLAFTSPPPRTSTAATGPCTAARSSGARCCVADRARRRRRPRRGRRGRRRAGDHGFSGVERSRCARPIGAALACTRAARLGRRRRRPRGRRPTRTARPRRRRARRRARPRARRAARPRRAATWASSGSRVP